MVKERLEKLNIAHQSDLGKRLWNCDETGIWTALQSKKNSGTKGFKVGTLNRWRVTKKKHNSSWLLLCQWRTSASLYRLQRKNLYSSWSKGGPAGAAYSTSKSGWMKKKISYHGLKKCFCLLQLTFFR